MGLALEAAARLAQDGVEVDVLDLRWLAPLDDEAILASVRRCGGRMLVVHEANVTGGVGAELATRVASAVPGAAVRRLGAPDSRIAASPELQEALMPSAAKIAAEVHGLMN